MRPNNTPVPAQTDDTPATPIQGPAVITDDGAITAWEYLGHEAVTAEPSPWDNVCEFGARMEPAWLVKNEEGYELVRGATQCATQPIVVMTETSLDLWPGEIVTPDCEAMDTLHLITITTEITTGSSLEYTNLSYEHQHCGTVRPVCFSSKKHRSKSPYYLLSTKLTHNMLLE